MSDDSKDIKPKQKINVKPIISNKVTVHKDPSFNIGDIVRSGFVRNYLIQKTKLGIGIE